MKMSDIKFPPVGSDRPWIVTCNGVPFAGFDNRDDAIKAANMYSKKAGKSSSKGKGKEVSKAVVIGSSYNFEVQKAS